MEAKKIESPVLNELLTAARKGDSQTVSQCLARERGGSGLQQPHAVLDKVSDCSGFSTHTVETTPTEQSVCIKFCLFLRQVAS